MSKNKNKQHNQAKVVPIAKSEPTLSEIEANAIATAKANAEREAAELAAMRAKYPLRKLTGGDLFRMLSLLSKLDLKDDLVAMYKDNVTASVKVQKERLLNDHKEKKADALVSQVRNLEDQAEVSLRGVDIMGQLFEKVTSNLFVIQNELNEFLGSLIGKNADEMAELPLADYFFILKELFGSDDFKTFFKSASSLVG